VTKIWFQFQYGAIKRKSIYISAKFPPKFQFQYGAIKRYNLLCLQAYCLQFQFQYGAIKSTVSTLPAGTQGSFNSNMVRLKEIRHRRLSRH